MKYLLQNSAVLRVKGLSGPFGPKHNKRALEYCKQTNNLVVFTAAIVYYSWYNKNVSLILTEHGIAPVLMLIPAPDHV